MKRSFRVARIKRASSRRGIGLKSFIPRQEAEMRDRDMEDQLVLYGKKFSSRLLLGTARYESPHQLTDAISAADPAMLTVSLRRQVSGSKDSGHSFWRLLQKTQRTILPNTAGCLSPHEAVITPCPPRNLFHPHLITLHPTH